jgi:hypothetical protein
MLNQSRGKLPPEVLVVANAGFLLASISGPNLETTHPEMKNRLMAV